ncbi:protein-only RNase P domain-containing protein [Ditylenchus destructor]|uniref:Protein-only RNase P domain-containing protein n=1 Tax=Ditylenchus destructor TaxID=166010 RepID=A0AAD4MYI3_9BILA|nr:protein-only RNase P domain-containing protein [Ditylenchus destructor]
MDNFTEDNLPQVLQDLSQLRQTQRPDAKALYPATFLFAAAHAYGVPQRIGFDKNESANIALYLREGIQSLPMPMMKSTLENLLDACDGKFDFAQDGFEKESFLQIHDCLHLIGSLAIRHNKLDVLRRIFAHSGRAMHSHKRFPVHSTIMDVLDSPHPGMAEGIDRRELVRAYLDQLSNVGVQPTIHLFEECIKPTIEKIPEWNLSESRVVDGKCERCGSKLLPRRTLSEEEHKVLMQSVQELIKNPPGRFSRDHKRFKDQYEQMLANFGAMMTKVKLQRHLKPLIVDGFNMLYTRDIQKGVGSQIVSSHFYKEYWDYNSMHKQLLRLKERERFSPIIVIFKNKMAQEFLPRLRSIGVFSFTTKSRTEDDLLILATALHFGLNAHIITNDEYRNYRDDLMKMMSHESHEIMNIFSKWQRCSFIKHTNYPTSYELPSNLEEVVQKNGGNYHVFIQPDYVFRGVVKYPFYCINTTKE